MAATMAQKLTNRIHDQAPSRSASPQAAYRKMAISTWHHMASSISHMQIEAVAARCVLPTHGRAKYDSPRTMHGTTKTFL
jgi:hypothetical protein